MASSTDLIGALRAYAQKALGNDFNAEKAATALNSWVKESGDALKERVERETERAVKKLGLVKESQIAALRDEILQLRAELGLTVPNSKSKSAGKKKNMMNKKKQAPPRAKKAATKSTSTSRGKSGRTKGSTSGAKKSNGGRAR